MSTSTDWFSELLQFGDWQLERLVTALRENELHTDERVVWLLNHVVNARQIWLERARDGVVSSSISTEHPFDELVKISKQTTSEWISWLQVGGDDRLVTSIPYVDFQGNSFVHEVRRMLMHIINHNTHHLGELVRMLRLKGIPPPRTDYIVFVRDHQL